MMQRRVRGERLEIETQVNGNFRFRADYLAPRFCSSDAISGKLF